MQHVVRSPAISCLQQLDYLQFLDLYHDRIKMFHVKDAEFSSVGTAGRLRAATSPGSNGLGASAR